ncbi:MAG: 4Fe-4S dicluster domain-containing protein [Bacteroidota bacterium]
MSKRGANSSYFGNIGEAISSLLTGLKLSFRHLWQARKKREPMGVGEDNYFERQNGIVTLQYPHETFPVPDNGRYQLHNEIDDCIVCDKCAKICPVNCIDIEPVRAVGEIGKTSDGSSKRIYAATFDIDMAKCCFCGLCTTVCPTECLTMTKEYDFSVFDIQKHTFAFSEMSDTEITEKKQEFEAYQKQKAAAKASSSAAKPKAAVRPKVGARPAFKPKMPVIKKPANPKRPPQE